MSCIGLAEQNSNNVDLFFLSNLTLRLTTNSGEENILSNYWGESCQLCVSVGQSVLAGEIIGPYLNMGGRPCISHLIFLSVCPVHCVPRRPTKMTFTSQFAALQWAGPGPVPQQWLSSLRLGRGRGRARQGEQGEPGRPDREPPHRQE